MILFLIFIGLFVLSLVSLIIFCIIDNKSRYYCDVDGFKLVSAALLILSVLVVSLMGIGTIDNHRDRTFELLEAERLDLVSTYNEIKDSGVADNNVVVGKILEYNEKVRKKKYDANNPWTSWFYDADKVSNLKLIELGD